jgi:hypothetical protein
MDWQQPASLAVVALAGFLFIRREIRSRRRARSRACGADCGCGTGDAPGSSGALLSRHEPGESQGTGPDTGTP